MIRVLQIVSCLEMGGTEAFIMNHYRHIDRDKVQFDFLVFNKGNYPYLKEIEQLGGKVFWAVNPSLKSAIQFYEIFRRIIREHGPYAAVHCHVNSGNAIPLVCAKLMGIRNRISHSHDTKQLRPGVGKAFAFHFKRQLIRCVATKYFACGEEAGAELYGNNFFKKNGQVIHNGIDLPQFIYGNESCVESLRKEFGLSNQNDLVIGNISRFEPKKNQMFAIDVFSELLKLRPNAVMLLGGIDGGQLQEVLQKIERLQLQDHIRYIGVRKDVCDCLHVMDAYLFPSLYEGVPIAFLEAQASGCMCIASDGVPLESDMGLGSVFFLKLSQTPAEWAAAIDERYNNFVRPIPSVIPGKFEEKGYNLDSSSEFLMKIYEA